MARKQAEEGEQLDLIDVSPENAKPIIKAARRYKALQAERRAALEKEVEQKQKVLTLIHQSDIKPLDDGSIKFSCNGVMISVTPRDELIKVKEEENEK